MPLDSSGIVKGARVRARWFTDLYNLFTGVMVDQDVVFGRNLTVRGALTTVGAQNFVAAGPTIVALKAQGAVGQGTSLFELQDSNANILFRIDQGGTLIAPKIADFTNADHTHASVAQGGPIGAAAISAAMLGTDVQRTNLLQNGSLDKWALGNGPFTANLAVAADKWQVNIAGTDALSVTRDSANADVAGQYCAACAYTVGAPTVPSSALYQSLDQYALRGKVVTFSVRVKSAVANVCRPFIFDGFNAARVYGAFHSGSGAYALLSVTTTINAGSTSAPLVGVEFNTTSGTYYVDNAMLNIGAAPADFVPALAVPEQPIATGLVISAGGLTVTAGGLTVTAGGETITAGGLAVLGGNLGVGQAPSATSPILIQGGTINASGGVAEGIRVNDTLVAQVNGDALSGVNILNLYSPNAKTGVTATGLNVSAVTGANATNYGVYITAPTGATTNIGLRVAGGAQGGILVDAGGLTVTAGGITVATGGVTITSGGLTVTAGGAAVLAGNLGVGALAIIASQGIASTPNALVGTTQTGVYSSPIGTSGATVEISGFTSQPQTAAAAFTATTIAGFHAIAPFKGASSVITNAYGLLVDPIAAGNSYNYGVYIGSSSGGSQINEGLHVVLPTGGIVTPTGIRIVGSAGFGIVSDADIMAAAVGTTSTTGFLCVGAASGTPTGVPANGLLAIGQMYYDYAAHKLYVYEKSTLTWKGVVLA